MVRSPEGHLLLHLSSLADRDTFHLTNTAYPELQVAVTDAQSHSIPGAEVEFHFPAKGASVVFRSPCRTDQASGDKVLCTTTKADGIASVTELHANHMAGDFKIRVNASFGGETTAFAEITEHNTRPGFYTRNKRKLWISGAAAAVAVSTILLLRPSSKPSATVGTVAGTGPVTGP